MKYSIIALIIVILMLCYLYCQKSKENFYPYDPNMDNNYSLSPQQTRFYYYFPYKITSICR